MRSLRWRTTAVVVAVLVVILSLLAAGLYVGVRAAVWRQYDTELAARARALAEITELEDGGYEFEIPPEPRGVPASFVEVWRPDGSMLVRSEALHDDLPRAFAHGETAAFLDVTLPDHRAGRAVGIRFTPRGQDDPTTADSLVLVLASGTETVDGALATVRRWFTVLGSCAVLAVALATAWSLGRGLRPLVRLGAELEQLDDCRLGTRLVSTMQPLELQVPVKKLDDLLGRLDAAFARERQFTADVSHELRTPLAGLRTLLEVAAHVERTPEDYREALREAISIVTQLGALVENLLMLVRLDAGPIELVSHPVPLRELVVECWRPYAARAAERGLVFRNLVPEDAALTTDRERLRLVLGNLLANAVEYTESGGWIEVASLPGSALEVADSGPMIPAAQLERVFDRLWRGDDARADADGVHCGIGLALSRSLCTCLALSLEASSTDERTAFRIARATA